MKSIAELSESTSDDMLEYQTLQREFLIFFKNMDSKEKQEALNLEPKERELQPAILALAGAMAEKLANDWGLEIPEWCLKEKYSLHGDDFYFLFSRDGKAKEHTIIWTPPEYRARNLFVTRNFLETL